MKNIASLSVDISKYGDRVIDNLIKAQRDTAKDLLKDVKAEAPGKGAYRDSIQMSDTTYDGNTIRTSVYTDATVSDSLGREYNLGKLIEYGTRPHLIEPAKKQVLKFTIDGKTVFASHVFHPGTAENPHFQRALQKNIALYNFNIRKAIKEAK